MFVGLVNCISVLLFRLCTPHSNFCAIVYFWSRITLGTKGNTRSNRNIHIKINCDAWGWYPGLRRLGKHKYAVNVMLRFEDIKPEALDIIWSARQGSYEVNWYKVDWACMIWRNGHQFCTGCSPPLTLSTRANTRSNRNIRIKINGLTLRSLFWYECSNLSEYCLWYPG